MKKCFKNMEERVKGSNKYKIWMLEGKKRKNNGEEIIKETRLIIF